MIVRRASLGAACDPAALIGTFPAPTLTRDSETRTGLFPGMKEGQETTLPSLRADFNNRILDSMQQFKIGDEFRRGSGYNPATVYDDLMETARISCFGGTHWSSSPGKFACSPEYPTLESVKPLARHFADIYIAWMDRALTFLWNRYYSGIYTDGKPEYPPPPGYQVPAGIGCAANKILGAPDPTAPVTVARQPAYTGTGVPVPDTRDAPITYAPSVAPTGGGSSVATGRVTAQIVNRSRPGSASFQIGDTIELTVSGPPNSPVSISANVGGRDWGTTPFGYTDGKGVRVITSTLTAEHVGNWAETIMVGAATPTTLNFTVGSSTPSMVNTNAPYSSVVPTVINTAVPAGSSGGGGSTYVPAPTASGWPSPPAPGGGIIPDMGSLLDNPAVFYGGLAVLGLIAFNMFGGRR